MHHKSCSHKDFFQIGFIQGGCESCVVDAYLACQFVLQQAACRASHDAEVRVRMTFANTALVFLKRHVELPVQMVLNAPVVTHHLGKAASREIPAENVVADLVALLAAALRLAQGNSDGLQFRPTRTVGQILRHGTDNIITRLFAAMSLLPRFMATCLGAGEVVLEVIVEECLDPLVQCRLVSLDGQDVVGSGSDDFLGDRYNDENPDYWLVEVSGIPFGLFGGMLQDGGNPWRGMIYGITNRFPLSDPRLLWKVWDNFGIQNARMIGYWDPACPITTSCEDVLATAYVGQGKTLIAVARAVSRLV